MPVPALVSHVFFFLSPDDAGERATKRRRIHLDPAQCEELSQTPEGSQALTNPGAVRHSSRDPHRGLYPRADRPPRLPLLSDPTMTGSFTMASNLLHHHGGYGPPSAAVRPPTEASRRSWSSQPEAGTSGYNMAITSILHTNSAFGITI